MLPNEDEMPENLVMTVVYVLRMKQFLKQAFCFTS